MRNSKETVIPTALRRPTTAEVPGFRHPCELCEAPFPLSRQKSCHVLKRVPTVNMHLVMQGCQVNDIQAALGYFAV